MSLQQIWILQESGACLFHKKFDDSCYDENLISGFLSAVNSFVESFGAEIQWIETNKQRFVFKISDQIIFVACTDITDHAPLTHQRLVRIADNFHLMFKNEIFHSGEPIPTDIFKKISPTIIRIFGMSDEPDRFIISKPQIVNIPEFRFNTSEARLMSFIRYRRRVSINDIMQYLKVSNKEAENVLSSLEDKRYIQRAEDPDGFERFHLHPYIRTTFQ